MEQAINNRNWETLEDEKLKKAEQKLREQKNQEKKDRDLDYAVTVDKWLGVQKEMIKRGIDLPYKQTEWFKNES